MCRFRPCQKHHFLAPSSPQNRFRKKFEFDEKFISEIKKFLNREIFRLIEQ